MGNDWKDRLGVVYSTNPDFQYTHHSDGEEETLSPEKQSLRVSVDRKQRKGKVVTLVTGFIGTEEDLKALAKKLKVRCGVGGSHKDGIVFIQGEWIEKLKLILKEEGYRVE